MNLNDNIYNMLNVDITIASGQTASDVIDTKGHGVLYFILPAAFTGTTITFQMSPDNSTFYDCYNVSDAQMTATVTQGRCYVFEPQDLVGLRYIKFVSGSAEGADRTITVGLRQLD